MKKILVVVLIIIAQFIVFEMNINAFSTNKYNEGTGTVYEFFNGNGGVVRVKLENGVLYYCYDGSTYQEVSKNVNAVAFDKNGKVYYIYMNKWLYSTDVSYNNKVIKINNESIAKDAIGFTYDTDGIIALNCYTNIGYIPLPIVKVNPNTPTPIPTASVSPTPTPSPTVVPSPTPTPEPEPTINPTESPSPKPEKYAVNGNNKWTYFKNGIAIHNLKAKGNLLYMDKKLIAKNISKSCVAWGEDGSKVYFVGLDKNGYVYNVKTKKTRIYLKNGYIITYDNLGFFKGFYK